MTILLDVFAVQLKVLASDSLLLNWRNEWKFWHLLAIEVDLLKIMIDLHWWQQCTGSEPVYSKPDLIDLVRIYKSCITSHAIQECRNNWGGLLLRARSKLIDMSAFIYLSEWLKNYAHEIERSNIWFQLSFYVLFSSIFDIYFGNSTSEKLCLFYIDFIY